MAAFGQKRSFKVRAGFACNLRHECVQQSYRQLHAMAMGRAVVRMMRMSFQAHLCSVKNGKELRRPMKQSDKRMPATSYETAFRSPPSRSHFVDDSIAVVVTLDFTQRRPNE